MPKLFTALVRSDFIFPKVQIYSRHVYIPFCPFTLFLSIHIYGHLSDRLQTILKKPLKISYLGIRWLYMDRVNLQRPSFLEWCRVYLRNVDRILQNLWLVLADIPKTITLLSFRKCLPNISVGHLREQSAHINALLWCPFCTSSGQYIMIAFFECKFYQFPMLFKCNFFE